MKRGLIVTVQQPGSFANKARPCLVVQNDLALGQTNWVTVCPITSILTGASTIRIAIGPGNDSGLLRPSEVEVDMIFAAKRINIGDVVGRASPSVMTEIDQALRRWLDL